MSTYPSASDHRFRELRDQIAENDRTIVKLIAKRVALVRLVWKLKDEMGLPREDDSRERWLHQFLYRSSFGTLKPATIDHITDFLLDLTKEELGVETKRCPSGDDTCNCTHEKPDHLKDTP